MTPIRISTISANTVISYICVAILIGLFGVYIAFQARFLITGPEITLFNEPSVVQNERQITLQGLAQNITEIDINGREITTDETGNFAESVVLENGYTIISVRARDRYGRTTIVEREFVYVPHTAHIN